MALVLLSACSKEEATDIDNNEGGPSAPEVEQPEFISFSATKNPLLTEDGQAGKSDDKFIQDDAISVYAWSGEYSEENFIARNSIYKCSPEGFFDPIAGTDTINWKDKETPHYFIATYPEHEIATDLKNFSFDYYDSDLLVARCLGENGAGISAANDTVGLAFSHVMSRVNVVFSLTGDFEGGTVRIMRFNDVADKGILDIIDNKITASGQADLGFASVAGNWTADVIPQEIKANSLEAMIETEVYGRRTYFYDKPLTFKSGYVYTLTFTPKGEDALQLVSVDMIPWTDAGSLGEGALFPATQASQG